MALLQTAAAAALYPTLSLAVIAVTDLHGAVAENEVGEWTAHILGWPFIVAAIFLLVGTFLVAPLGLCMGGVAIVALVARRQGRQLTGPLLLKFAIAVTVLNVGLALVGAWLWPEWWYTEKLAARVPLWLLVVLFGGTASIAASVAAVVVVVRPQLRTR